MGSIMKCYLFCIRAACQMSCLYSFSFYSKIIEALAGCVFTQLMTLPRLLLVWEEYGQVTVF